MIFVGKAQRVVKRRREPMMFYLEETVRQAVYVQEVKHVGEPKLGQFT
jgi:hypothetical protein